jgi:hypothetical protein
MQVFRLQIGNIRIPAMNLGGLNCLNQGRKLTFSWCFKWYLNISSWVYYAPIEFCRHSTELPDCFLFPWSLLECQGSKSLTWVEIFRWVTFLWLIRFVKNACKVRSHQLLWEVIGWICLGLEQRRKGQPSSIEVIISRIFFERSDLCSDSCCVPEQAWNPAVAMRGYGRDEGHMMKLERRGKESFWPFGVVESRW